MRELIRGGKEYITMEVTRASGTTFTISGANYIVRDASLAATTDTGAASIDGEKVYALVDTSQDMYTADSRYAIDFQVAITGLSKLLIGRVPFYVKS